jgi:propionyl-CoA carboxylase beta chain
VRPLRRAARRARRHPRLPARHGQERAGVIRHGAALLRAFARGDHAARHRDAAPGLRRGPHRHELARPRSRPHAGLARRQDRRHGARARPWSSCTAARSPAGSDPQALADAYAAEQLPVREAAARGFVDEVVAPAQTP